MRAVFGVVLVVFLGVQYALWFGDKSVFDLVRKYQGTEEARLLNASLAQENGRLLAEVIDLKEEGETVETLARSRFGLVKENETFYQIVE